MSNIKRAPRLCGLLAATILAGCSSKPIVTELPAMPPPQIKGVPFRVKAEQIVHIYALQADGAYKQVSVSKNSLADYGRLYTIDVESQPFASSSLHITEGADNTLSLMQVTGTDNTAATLDAVNTGVAGITKANSDKSAAALAAATAANNADKAVRDAQDALDKLPSTASDETRAIYQQAVQSAKKAAALAREAADLPIP